MLIDSHAHLDYENYVADLPEVLDRAMKAGVVAILTVGCVEEDPGSGDRTLQLATGHEQLYAALGVHPHDAHFFSPALNQRILHLMNHPKVLGWGEIGLDFHYEYSSPEEQCHAFRQQLRSAQDVGKPVIIHTREADRRPVRFSKRR
jgi:TatD DNase family protein